MDVETVPVADLHVDPANVRRHPARNLEAIRASLARFGQVKPIVVDGRNVVRAGNGTLEAARSLGWDSVAIVRTGLLGPEATAYSIADNRTAELAEWDDTALAEQLRALQSEDFDLDAAGFTAEEVDGLIAAAADGLIVPDFGPVGEDEQGRLDEKARVTCPECGHHFTP
jgi:ParB-like chromosome segregation protein Spo0J